MEKKVRIFIHSAQGASPETAEVIEYQAQGTLGLNPEGAVLLSYDEPDSTGMAGTQTTLFLKKDRLTLTRMGTLNARMVFQAGLRKISHYNTPYGTIDLEVFTQRLEQSMTEAGGTLALDYQLTPMQDGKKSCLTLSFHLQVSPLEGEATS